jgi:hypothetical protein
MPLAAGAVTSDAPHLRRAAAPASPRCPCGLPGVGRHRLGSRRLPRGLDDHAVLTERCGHVALPVDDRHGRTLAGRPSGGLGGRRRPVSAALGVMPAGASQQETHLNAAVVHHYQVLRRSAIHNRRMCLYRRVPCSARKLETRRSGCGVTVRHINSGSLRARSPLTSARHGGTVCGRRRTSPLSG